MFLQITAGELTQGTGPRKWQVDVSTIIGIGRTVNDAALAALARVLGVRPTSGTGSSSRPGPRSAS